MFPAPPAALGFEGWKRHWDGEVLSFKPQRRQILMSNGSKKFCVPDSHCIPIDATVFSSDCLRIWSSSSYCFLTRVFWFSNENDPSMAKLCYWAYRSCCGWSEEFTASDGGCRKLADNCSVAPSEF